MRGARRPAPTPPLAGEATVSDCTSSSGGTSTTNPLWSQASTSTQTFSSFHLHVSWAAGNTEQAAAVTSFKTAIISAGASSSCSAVSDTSDYFCYSMVMNDYTATAKQDPFYNYEMFIFVGATYFKDAVTFAMRYRMADLASTYGVDVLVHPNSQYCPGNDHLRWSIFFERQFPLNTCPFWFQSKCGFRRELGHSLDVMPRSLVTGQKLPSAITEAFVDVEPVPVILERGGSSGRARAHARNLAVEADEESSGPRSLSSSSSTYSTSSCTSYKSVTSYTLYVVWNTMNGDDLVAKEAILTRFAAMYGISRNAANCETYTRIPSSASTTAPTMCTEVTSVGSTSWFPAPYGYAPINVPSSLFKMVLTWFMRNHDSTNLASSTSLPLYSLPFFLVPNTGCAYYDFEHWSVRSDNNTINFNCAWESRA